MRAQISSLSMGLIVLCGAAGVIGASGFTESHVFHQASTLKYVVTVAAPLGGAALLVVSDPLLLLAGVLLIAAPFAGFSMTAAGVHVPLLAPILLCAGFVDAVCERGSGRRSSLLPAGLLFLCLVTLPVIESPERTAVIATLVSLGAGAYFAARVSRTEHGLVTLAWAFVASAALQSVIALWESHTGHTLNLYGAAGSQTLGAGYFFSYGSHFRPPAAFYDPDSLGNFLAIAIVLDLGVLIHSSVHRRWGQVALAAAAAGVIGVALEVTLSRMSWIGAGIGVLVVGAIVPGFGRRLVPLLAVVALGLLSFGVFGHQSATVQRLGSITHPLNESNTGNGDVLRLDVWKDALSVGAQHPVAGVGLGEFANLLSAKLSVVEPSAQGGNAQSVYLQLFAEGGALALCGLIAVLIALGRDLVRVVRADRVWGGALAGACTAMLLCWLTDVTVRYSGVALCMGVLFGMVAGRSRAGVTAKERSVPAP